MIPYFNKIEEIMVKSVQKSDEFWRFGQNAYEFNYEKELHSEQSDEAALKALNRLLKSPIPRNILKISYRKNKRMISEYDFYMERMNEVLKEMEDVLLEVDWQFFYLIVTNILTPWYPIRINLISQID